MLIFLCTSLIKYGVTANGSEDGKDDIFYRQAYFDIANI